MFFENSSCLSCGRALAFVPQRLTMVSLNQEADGAWSAVDGTQEPPRYRLCANYASHAVCNWAIPAEAPETLCRSCELTHTIPDLDAPGNRDAWAKLEAAKRRLVHALLTLGLPLQGKSVDPQRGLQFRFMADSVTPIGDRSRVMTGHDNGLITINIAEADDVYRETQRQHQREPYRTLLGHFRHEIGHYYWDVLIAGGERLEGFRQLFGDERADYQQALQQHYSQGAPQDWPGRFISAYASMHPWEDWAETWAHVMHMVDALETAGAAGLSVQPQRADEPVLAVPDRPVLARLGDFDQLLVDWAALTYILNNLSRGLGLPDAYPFVISAPVIEKLRFVCRAMAG